MVLSHNDIIFVSNSAVIKLYCWQPEVHKDTSEATENGQSMESNQACPGYFTDFVY